MTRKVSLCRLFHLVGPLVSFFSHKLNGYTNIVACRMIIDRIPQCRNKTQGHEWLNTDHRCQSAAADGKLQG